MYRLKQHKKGWMVQVKRPFWWSFGLLCKWKHVTYWAGLPDQPFYYKTPESAITGALEQIRDDIRYSFRYKVGRYAQVIKTEYCDEPEIKSVLRDTNTYIERL